MGQIVCLCSSSQLQQSYSRRYINCIQSVPSFPCSNSMRIAEKMHEVFISMFWILIYVSSLFQILRICWDHGARGVVVLGFFPTAATEKKHCTFSYTKKWGSLNYCLQKLGIYLKTKESWYHWTVGRRRRYWGFLYTGQCYVRTFLLILSIMDAFASFLSLALHFRWK